jgi:hypothetical protein
MKLIFAFLKKAENSAKPHDWTESDNQARFEKIWYFF